MTSPAEVSNQLIKIIRDYERREFFAPKHRLHADTQRFDSAANIHRIGIKGHVSENQRLQAEIIIEPVSMTQELAGTLLENFANNPELAGLTLRVIADLPVSGGYNDDEQLHIEAFYENETGEEIIFPHPELGSFIVAILNGGLHQTAK
jgi:hypothetical protein